MLRSSADCARAFTECLRSSLAALSRRLELHSRTPGQNSAYGACHRSCFLLLEGGGYSPRSPPPVSAPVYYIILLENEKFFELKSRGYRDGIKRKETR